MQSLTNGKAVVEPTQTFRWHGEGGQTGFLEASVATESGRAIFTPYANPAIGNDGENGPIGAVDNAVTSATSACGGQTRSSAVAAAALGIAPHGSELRAVQNGQLGIVRSGYQQSGTIAYNGFTVVEQVTRGSQTILYNKSDLERLAERAGATVSEALDSDRSVTIGLRADGAHVMVQSLSREHVQQR